MAYELKRIRADGKKTARIAVIGEAGGREERIKLRPFVGWSGRTLSSWWSLAGLKRSDVWLDNVYPFTPPIKGGAPRLEMVHPDDLKFWMADLHDRLAQLRDVNVIVPVGDLALKAVMGMKGITKYRGSILTYPQNEKVKVIPTLHPAYTARRPLYAKSCIADWKRIAEEAKTSEIVLPQREYLTHPTIDDIEWFYSSWIQF